MPPTLRDTRAIRLRATAGADRTAAEPTSERRARTCTPHTPRPSTGDGRLRTENALTPHDLTLRPITGPEEIDLFNRLPYVLNAEIRGDLEAGRRRTRWLWVALRGDRVVARAAWWSRPGDEHPLLMDVFDVTDGIEDGVRLLEAALAALVPPGGTPPGYGRFVPPDWRAHDESRRAVRDRMAALERVGARLFVERLRLHWLPGTPVPAPSGRLEFRPPRDAAELIGLMTLVLDGTLDAHSRDELRSLTAREAAERQYREELERYASPRDWWRVATLPGGELAGFVIPAHNGYNVIIAYLAVLPAHRGNGYIDDVLAEGTRLLAAEGVSRIRAATDVGNTPMARSFARVGYTVFEREIDMTWG
nr:GNAT family N-acetyltransferase [Actinoplanes digitatis]